MSVEFVELLAFEDFRVENIYQSYCATFPEIERRNERQFQQLFKNQHARIFAVLNDFKFVGYFILWELNDFVFLEHFEIFTDFRRLYLGSEVLKKISEINSKIVLETEHEKSSENAIKRIKFYEKNNFQPILETYVQPGYGDGKEKIELLLYANFTPENLTLLVENIYDVVYGKY